MPSEIPAVGDAHAIAPAHAGGADACVSGARPDGAIMARAHATAATRVVPIEVVHAATAQASGPMAPPLLEMPSQIGVGSPPHASGAPTAVASSRSWGGRWDLQPGARCVARL
jgi:hypothetical protein